MLFFFLFRSYGNYFSLKYHIDFWPNDWRQNNSVAMEIWTSISWTTVNFLLKLFGTSKTNFHETCTWKCFEGIVCKILALLYWSLCAAMDMCVLQFITKKITGSSITFSILSISTQDQLKPLWIPPRCHFQFRYSRANKFLPLRRR